MTAYRNLIVPHFVHTLFARLKLARLGLRDFKQVANQLMYSLNSSRLNF